MRRALTDEEEAEVVARYERGMSTLQLAERFGTTESSVRRTLDRNGVERRPRQERAGVTSQQIVEKREAGWTWAQVAAWAGCSPTTARNRWKEAATGGS